MTSSKKKLPTFTRRQALALCGAAPIALDPVRVLLNGLIDGLISNAQAETVVTGKPRNYIYIGMQGGPPRWTFDLPITPYSGMSIVRNPNVNTRFADLGNTRGLPEYATTPVTVNGVTLNMPWLWSSSIPTASGGTVPMTTLMENMAMIRGVRLLQDGHPNNAMLQIRPNTSAPSLSGLVADGSTAPIPAVGLKGGPYGGYKSGKGTGQAIGIDLAPSDNPLGNLLSPFNQKVDGVSSTYMTRRAAMEEAMNIALGKLGEYAKSAAPGSENLFNVRTSAQALLKQGIGDVSAAYTTLYNKYTKLITQAMSPSTAIVGLNDKPIAFSAYSKDSNGDCAETYIEITSSNIVSARNTDLRTIMQATSGIRRLAEGMAIAEYLVSNGYSSSVVCGFDQISNLTAETSNGTATVINGMDEHAYGSATSLLTNSFMYRALAACVYELISVLKSKDLFNETVIQIGGDFNRNPNAQGNGSGHGYNGSNATFFTGAIKAPVLVGNILLNDPTTKLPNPSPGTWGQAGTGNVGGFTRELGIGNVASTIAQFLRVESPSPNDTSVLADDGTAAMEKAKNV